MTRRQALYGGHRQLTLLLQEDTTLCDDNGHIAVDEALTLVIGEGNGNVRIFDADVEWNPENTPFLQTYWTSKQTIERQSPTRSGDNRVDFR